MGEGAFAGLVDDRFPVRERLQVADMLVPRFAPDEESALWPAVADTRAGVVVFLVVVVVVVVVVVSGGGDVVGGAEGFARGEGG